MDQEEEERIDALASLSISQGWAILLDWFGRATNDVRDELETPGLSEARAEYLRGRVATLREVALLPRRLGGE